MNNVTKLWDYITLVYIYNKKIYGRYIQNY